jgi:hypothetical protein
LFLGSETMDLQERVYYLVTKDLNNVLSSSKKNNSRIASWYWRLEETEEEWVNRLVKLSIERKEVRGYILGDKSTLSYRIPLESNNDEVVVEICENMQQKEIRTSYELLYDTIEKYL